jgi:hypothetical protein
MAGGLTINGEKFQSAIPDKLVTYFKDLLDKLDFGDELSDSELAKLMKYKLVTSKGKPTDLAREEFPELYESQEDTKQSQDIEKEIRKLRQKLATIDDEKEENKITKQIETLKSSLKKARKHTDTDKHWMYAAESNISKVLAILEGKKQKCKECGKDLTSKYKTGWGAYDTCMDLDCKEYGKIVKPLKEDLNEGTVTIEKADGEYRVPAEDGYEDGAYYTDDKEDAVSTAKKVFGDDATIKFRSVPEFAGGKYDKYRPKGVKEDLDESINRGLVKAYEQGKKFGKSWEHSGKDPKTGKRLGDNNPYIDGNKDCPDPKAYAKAWKDGAEDGMYPSEARKDNPYLND